MKQVLLDVVWDDALMAELDKLLAGFRLMAALPDDGAHSIGAAVRRERELRALAIRRIRLLLERRRVECHDLDVADSLTALKAAWDRTGGEAPERWWTPGMLEAEFGLPAHTICRRLAHADCPVFEVLRGPTGRVIKLKLNPELRAWLSMEKQPGKLLLA